MEIKHDCADLSGNLEGMSPQKCHICVQYHIFNKCYNISLTNEMHFVNMERLSINTLWFMKRDQFRRFRYVVDSKT